MARTLRQYPSPRQGRVPWALVSWGARLFLVLNLLDVLTTLLGLAYAGAAEGAYTARAFATLTHLPMQEAILLFSVLKLLIVWGLAHAWRGLLRWCDSGVQVGLVVGSLGIACVGYALLVAHNLSFIR